MRRKDRDRDMGPEDPNHYARDLFRSAEVAPSIHEKYLGIGKERRQFGHRQKDTRLSALA